jgi:ATP-dependent RNA circularization protein (DNA/RNA ligase family)
MLTIEQKRRYLEDMRGIVEHLEQKHGNVESTNEVDTMMAHVFEPLLEAAKTFPAEDASDEEIAAAFPEQRIAAQDTLTLHQVAVDAFIGALAEHSGEEKAKSTLESIEQNAGPRLASLWQIAESDPD